ncbi:MAG: hypothetical protein JST17_05825 [Bacteroidetes bacterium]|nr:hypothetical protein [Bacteroidota bacterium]MBS1929924.1 hypothetical protein [Bacteroidota bacterium]
MEVHHHHHEPHSHKKWHHYFWEFFMLFLAVTLGFLVENMREHVVDHKKEMQYVRSYTEDMHDDMYQLDSLINYNRYRNNIMDSLTQILNTPDPDQYGKKLYYYARMLTLTFPFFSNDRTIQQLKNGGNLRLIKKQDVSNAMMDYDRKIRFVDNIRSREEDYVREYVQWLEEVLDGRVFNEMMSSKFTMNLPPGNPQMLKKDKATILKFISKIHFLKAANSFSYISLVKAKQIAQKTLDIIKEEYHVE